LERQEMADVEEDRGRWRRRKLEWGLYCVENNNVLERFTIGK
jgi:hypothetical protein